MPVQGDLLGAPGPGAGACRLFFALLPGAAIRAEMKALVQSPGQDASLGSARWVRPERYHATLHFLGDHPQPRPDIIASASAAAGKLRAAPFDWVLDQLDSFRGRRPPLILRGATVPEAMQSFWLQLRHALILEGQAAELESRFVPHVTLAYAEQSLRSPVAITPIRWRITSFALLESVRGRDDYRVVDSWPLADGGLDR